MLSRRTKSLLAMLALLCATTIAAAQERVIPRERHAWGAFRPGSWKLVRVVSEKLDEKGEVTSTSTSDTKSLLLAADAKTYELQIDVTVQVPGKRFASEPKFVEQGYHGELPEQSLSLKKLPDESLKIAEQTRKVHAAEVEIKDGQGRRVSLLHFGDSQVPFILGRRTVAYDAEGHQLTETKVETIALDVPHTILGRRRFTFKVRTTQTNGQGKTVTEELHSPDVPGGVVWHSSEEFDDEGHVVRRSKLELANYGIATAASPPPPRRVPRRVRKAEERDTRKR